MTKKTTIMDRDGSTFEIDTKKLSGILIGKTMRKAIKKIYKKQSSHFLKTKAEEYGLKMGFFESKKSIRKRIENIIMGKTETLDNVVWPRPTSSNVNKKQAESRGSENHE